MEHGTGLHLLFIITGTYLGIYLGIIMLFVKARQSKANVFLGLILLCFCSFLIPRTIYELGLLEMLPHVVRIEIFTSFAFGPVTYFYVRACTQKDFTFRSILWLHFLPVVIDLIMNIPIFALSGPEKIDLLLNRINYKSGDLNPIPVALKSIHAVIYVALSIQLVYQYKKHVTNTASNIDESLHRWLLLFCGILLVPLGTLILFTVFGVEFLKLGIIGMTVFVFVNAVLLAIILKPALFHAFPHQISLTEIREEKEEEEKQKYENSNLQEIQKDKLSERLIAHLETEKSYQEPELTIAELAEQLKTPSHYLSQVINQKMGCTFLDFINQYRVKEAKEKLVDENYSHYTIIAIAYEVGFNSKTAFYNAFKKNTGKTPSQFRKSLSLQ